MKIVWKTVLDITTTSPMYFEGSLIKENQMLKYYLFKNWLGVSEIALDIKNGVQLYTQSDGNDVIEENKRKYSAHEDPKHYDCDDFIFEDYRIAHQGAWGYVCFKNEEAIWKKSLKGYLYTDIIRNGQNIVFGTAGYGGHFYSLDIDSGEIIFDFNTKGTSSFFCVNDSYYFCSREKKNSKLYRIDFRGNVLDSLEIPGSYRDYNCPITLSDNLICVITLLEKKREYFTPIINCVALG